MILRPEAATDRAAIHALVAEAFGREEEADLVEALRAAGDLALSLVAEDEGAPAAYAGFSRMQAPAGALALAPVAVRPAIQGRGIGADLIRFGLAGATLQGCAIVFVVGEPGYYGRFGFTADAAAGFASPYAGPHFMALALGAPPPPGPVAYPKAFEAFE